MNAIFIVLMCVGMPDDEYLGRLVYRVQTEKKYSWEDYQKDKNAYLSLSDVDKRAVAYASRLKQSFFSGTPSMRIQQTAPVIHKPKRVYPELWDSPPYRPYYPYPGYYNQFNYPYCPNSNFQYHIIIH